MNKQISLSELRDELMQVKTHKKGFLAQIERIVPWGEWEAMIRPSYYKGERGNKPYELELMLRLYLLQNLYDLSDEATVAEAIDSRAFSDFCGVESSKQVPDGDTLGRFRKIDLLINNAGYSLRGALEEVNVEDSKKIFDVNVFGILTVIQAVVPEMRRNNSGRIINIGSISGRFVQPINGVYCASKYAVEALTDALRLELHDFHIEATIIEPGPIETDFFKTLDRTSGKLLYKTDSCYSHFYEADVNYRKVQKRTPVNKAMATTAKNIDQKKLKPRYKVAVPFTFRLMLHLPDSLREYILRSC